MDLNLARCLCILTQAYQIWQMSVSSLDNMLCTFLTLVWPWPLTYMRVAGGILSEFYSQFFSCSVWNFNLANNFWTVSARSLIFHISIASDKNFLSDQLLFALWPWPWSLTYLLKTLAFLKTFEQSARVLIFHMSILTDQTFRGY